MVDLCQYFRQKKLKDYAAFFKFLILLLLRCHITNSTVYPLPCCSGIFQTIDSYTGFLSRCGEGSPLSPWHSDRRFYSFYRQFCCHGCSIRVSDDLTAAQVHYGSQIGPSLFLYMDIGYIRTPFLVDGFRPEITFQKVFFIIWNGSVIGIMVVFFTTTERSPCFAICRWTRFMLQGVPLPLRVRHILTAPYRCIESS